MRKRDLAIMGGFVAIGLLFAAKAHAEPAECIPLRVEIQKAAQSTMTEASRKAMARHLGLSSHQATADQLNRVVALAWRAGLLGCEGTPRAAIVPVEATK